MIVVKILGGLGNQMFQYAFARNLARRNGGTIFLDTSQFGQYALHDGLLLDKLFGVPYEKAPEKVVDRLATPPTSVFNRFRRKYLTKKTHVIDTWFGFNPAVLQPHGDVYYDGYWQSEKYFAEVADEVRAAFNLWPLQSAGNLAFMSAAERPIAAVHVRRGDYLTSATLNVCGIDYYRRALTRLGETTACRTIAVFSDDLAWCRENLADGDPRFVYVDWNGSDAGKDMALMAACDHNVIANSSFSWWAAYLNPNPGKTVIGPAIWSLRQLRSNDRYYKFTFDDILPAAWLRA